MEHDIIPPAESRPDAAENASRSLRGLLASDLATLRLIVAVCRDGSLSAAASACHQSVAAVSKRIKELELRLQTTLFERHARGVIPTETGRVMASYAQDVLRLSESTALELERRRPGFEQSVTLCSNASALAQYLPADLSAFASMHASIHVLIEERHSAGVVDALCAHRVDLAIHDGSVGREGIEGREYRQERFVVLTPPGHALVHAADGHVGLADVIEHGMVALPPGTAAQAHVDRAAERLGRRAMARIRAHSLEAACQFVAAGVGVAIVPAGLTTRWTRARSAVSLALDEPWARRKLQLSWSTQRALPEAAATFRDFLLARRPA